MLTDCTVSFKVFEAIYDSRSIWWRVEYMLIPVNQHQQKSFIHSAEEFYWEVLHSHMNEIN